MEWYWYGDAYFRSLFTYQNALWAIFVGIVLTSAYFLVHWGSSAYRAWRKGLLDGIGFGAVLDYVTLPSASLLIGILAIINASRTGISDPGSFLLGFQRVAVWSLVLAANLLRAGRFVFQQEEDVTRELDIPQKEHR